MCRLALVRFVALLPLFASAASVVGCDAAVEDEDVTDDLDSRFLGSDKADGLGIQEKSPAAQAVLDFANHASFERLDVDAKLAKRAAQNIVQRRPAGTGYTTLAELDRVPYVGPKVFQQLASYAPKFGFGRTWQAMMMARKAAGGDPASWDRMAVSNWTEWVPVERVRELHKVMEAEGVNYAWAFSEFVDAANLAPGSKADPVISGDEILGYLSAKHHVDALAISRVGLSGELRRDIQLLDWYVEYVLLHAIDEPAFEDAYEVTNIDIVVDQPDVQSFSLLDISNCAGVRAETCGWWMGDRSLVSWTVPVACVPAGFLKWASRAPRLKNLIDQFGILRLHTEWDDTSVNAIGLANDAYWLPASYCARN